MTLHWYFVTLHTIQRCGWVICDNPDGALWGFADQFGMHGFTQDDVGVEIRGLYEALAHGVDVPPRTPLMPAKYVLHEDIVKVTYSSGVNYD